VKRAIILILLSISSYAIELSVLTFNIGALLPHSTKTQASISKFCNDIKKESYEVLLIQEAWIKSYREQIIEECSFPYFLDMDSKMGLIRNYDNGKLRTLLAKFLALTFKYLIPAYGVDSGLLILSKYPLENPRRLIFSVSGSEDHIFDGELAVSKGAIGVFAIHPKLGKIFIANTHLTSNYFDHQYDENRRVQLAELSSWFREQSRHFPAILGGDFNISPPGKRYLNNSSLWKVMRKSYFNDHNFLKLSFSSLTTYPGESKSKDEGFVDHLIGLNGLFPIMGRVIPKHGISDHHALFAKFKLFSRSFVLNE